MTEITSGMDGSLYIAIQNDGGSSRIARLLGDGRPSASLDLAGKVVGMDLDPAGALLEEIQIPLFAGRPSPTATPRAGQTRWLAILSHHR